MTSLMDRYDWADFMRGLLMILVVVYHSESYYYTGYEWSWVFQPFFLTGFFFVSGFLFCGEINNVSLSKKAKQVFRGIVFPYCCFMLLISGPKLFVGHAEVHQLMIDIITMRASWFVIVVGVMQLLFALLLKISSTMKSLIVGTVIMFVLGYVLVVMYRNPPEWLITNPWLHSKELPNRLPVCINLALVQSPFFLLGIMYRRKEYKYRRYMTLQNLVISTLLYCILWVILDHKYIGSYIIVVTDNYNNILFVYFYALVGIWTLLCLGYKVRLCKPVNFIGKYSILFYFLNGGALTITGTLLRKIKALDAASCGGANYLYSNGNRYIAHLHHGYT